jgi:23S rRNA (pseudouridine1915-N3)-methyltransferase
MRFQIFTVGRIKDRALSAKLEEYLRRIRFEAKIDVVALKDSDRQNEGKRLIQALDRFNRAKVFALTEEGRQFSSVGFAEELSTAVGDIVFLIGGPNGLADEVKRRADTMLSLSKMTFPHEMALVLLAEQIFRALTILGGRSYHK